jgi:uncharacterized protein (DUF58 family)
MLKRRIACILLIISALIMYFFDNETVTLALLAALIVMPAVSIGLLALSGRKFRVSMERTSQTGENPAVKVRIENHDLIPIASSEAEVVCTNLRTGETDSCVISSTPRPGGTKEADLEILPRNAGRYEISVSSATISDPLQLASKNVECSDREYITIMPDTFEMHVSYASDAAMLEGDRSADSRRGNDPGEVRAIREYVPGDPVRNIHWKLSEKTDKLLVKELGNTITDNFLIILDTGREVSQDPIALEAIASVFVSLSATILRDSSGLSIGWTDPETGRAVIRKIYEEQELTAAADEYLAVPAVTHSAFRRIERDIAESRYAHIIIVGAMIPEGIDAIANGCQVTVLLYGESGSVTENNVTTVGFAAGSAESDLAGIEI